jgi:hypothetical protein
LDDQGHPKLPSGIPKPIPFLPIWGDDVLKSVEKERFINSGISKYLEFWKLSILKDEMYARVMKPYIDYWEGILKCLSKPIPQQSHVLLEGFWSTSNWKVNHMRFSIPSVPIFDNMEDPVIPPYYGPKNMKSSLSTITYNPFKDLHEGDFLLAHPFEPEMYPLWMERMHSDVIKDANDEHYQMVHVQWQVPFKKRTCNNAKLYRGCWEGKWKCYLTDPMQWVDIDSIMFSFLVRKSTTMDNMITISDVHDS